MFWLLVIVVGSKYGSFIKGFWLEGGEADWS